MGKVEIIGYKPEHQRRADSFELAGTQFLTSNYPSIKFETHDGMDRMIDGLAILSRKMAREGYLRRAKLFSQESLQIDRESAIESQRVFLLYQNRTEIISQAIDGLSTLAT